MENIQLHNTNITMEISELEERIKRLKEKYSQELKDLQHKRQSLIAKLKYQSKHPNLSNDGFYKDGRVYKMFGKRFKDLSAEELRKYNAETKRQMRAKKKEILKELQEG